MSRVTTTKHFDKLMPFSGDSIAVGMLTESGLFNHLVLKLPDGERIMLSIPAGIVDKYSEYFQIK